MMRPRRRLAFAVLAAMGVVLAVAGLWLGWKWKRAYDNVNAMIVPTLVLPSASPAPATTAAPTARTTGSSATPLPTPAPTATALPQADGPLNILLLGTDARPGDDISRTDSIMVVHLDPHTNRIAMLSLPRDLQVNVPQFGTYNINAAYPLGEKGLGKGYGAPLAKATVAKLLGIKIDYFMLINFDGFKTLIDRLGGISVDVPKVIDDPAYPTDDYRTIHVHFNLGTQMMDGQRALIYARTRHADNDFGRMQRQQQVIMAIFERVRAQGLLTQITSLDDYTDAMRDNIRTDMPRDAMLGKARMGPHLQADNIERYAIKPPLVVEHLQPSYALVLADKQGLQKLVEELESGSMAAGGEQIER